MSYDQICDICQAFQRAAIAALAFAEDAVTLTPDANFSHDTQNADYWLAEAITELKKSRAEYQKKQGVIAGYNKRADDKLLKVKRALPNRKAWKDMRDAVVAARAELKRGDATVAMMRKGIRLEKEAKEKTATVAAKGE